MINYWTIFSLLHERSNAILTPRLQKFQEKYVKKTLKMEFGEGGEWGGGKSILSVICLAYLEYRQMQWAGSSLQCNSINSWHVDGITVPLVKCKSICNMFRVRLRNFNYQNYNGTMSSFYWNISIKTLFLPMKKKIHYILYGVECL